MRLFSLLAVLSAVLSAGGAHACCFFKCFGKGTAAPGVTTDAARVRATAAYVAPFVEIVSVGGHAPDSTWNVAPALPPGFVEVIVEADPFASWASSIDLYVTDLGPIGTAVRAMAKGEKKRYKAHKSRLKYKWPTRARAAGVAAAPNDADGSWVWEITYLIDTATGHNYSAYAQGDYWEWSDWEWDWVLGTATSHTVTFHTASSVSTPPSPLPPVPALKK